MNSVVSKLASNLRMWPVTVGCERLSRRAASEIWPASATVKNVCNKIDGMRLRSTTGRLQGRYGNSAGFVGRLPGVRIKGREFVCNRIMHRDKQLPRLGPYWCGSPASTLRAKLFTFVSLSYFD